jgi:hypothetical protein
LSNLRWGGIGRDSPETFLNTMKTKQTQCQRLLAYLKRHKKGITQLEAFTALGICRLSERVRELERTSSVVCWYGITRTRERTPGGATVTRYKLAK